MLRSLDANSEVFLDNLNRIASRMQRAQRELATGLRFANVSDDPDQVSTLLQAHAELQSNQTIQDNLGQVKGEVDTAETALQSAVKLMERVKTLSAQGATGTATVESRQSIAGELGSLLEQLGGISRTTFEGRYLFSGDNDQTAPYTIDLSQANPISPYAGSVATRQVQHPNGTTFGVSRSALEIFDNPDSAKNVFFAVDTMRKALLANDSSAIRASLGGIGTALDHLNGQLAWYGTTQNKVAEATDAAQQAELQIKTHIGNLQDADMTEAILEVQQAQTQQQAALQLQGQIPRKTLFDFLG